METAPLLEESDSKRDSKLPVVHSQQGEIKESVTSVLERTEALGGQSQRIECAYRSGRLFMDIRRSLTINPDENWSDLSSENATMHQIGRACLKKLGYNSGFFKGELAAFQFLFNSQNSGEEEEYSHEYKMAFIRLLTIAKERILALFASLDRKSLDQIAEYCIPSETRPLKDMATAKEWTPYLREHYSQKPQFIEACMQAMTDIDADHMSLHQILTQAKRLLPVQAASL